MVTAATVAKYSNRFVFDLTQPWALVLSGGACAWGREVGLLPPVGIGNLGSFAHVVESLPAPARCDFGAVLCARGCRMYWVYVSCGTIFQGRRVVDKIGVRSTALRFS